MNAELAMARCWVEIDLDAEGYNILLLALQPREPGAAYSEETDVLEESLLQYFPNNI